MNRWEFEKICTDSRLRPVFRYDTQGATVLVADGWFVGHPDRPYPHYRTVWAIGKGEGDLRIGRDIYTLGTENSGSVDERIAVACEDALTAVVGMTEAQRMIREYRNPERAYDA